MKFLSLLIIVSLSMIASCKNKELSSGAKVTDNCSETPTGCKEYADKGPEDSRDFDKGASSYRINNHGQYQYKVPKTQNTWCDIGAPATEFKISKHPNDVYGSYVVMDGDLYKAYTVDEKKQIECVRNTIMITRIIYDVQKWKLISNPASKIFGGALSKDGTFFAWNKENEVYSKYDVIMDFEINPCYGSRGNYKDVIAFLRSKDNQIFMVMNDFSEKLDEGFYSTLQDFMSRNNVCN